MSANGERRAAVVLLGLAVVGLVVRVLSGSADAPGAVLYRPAQSERPEQDSLAARAARLARPLRAGERIDVDRARAEELTRLPRIGPALAARIVEDRRANGAFGSLEELDRVSGIGPTVLAGLASHVTFSGHARQRSQHRSRTIVSLNTASAETLAQLPGLGPVRARAIVEDRKSRGPYRTLENLMRVKGIGPGTIERLRGLVAP